MQIAPLGGYSEDLNAGTRARQVSPDRAYRDPSYPQDQAYYGPADAGPMQRRIYQQRGYYQGYEQDAGYQQPRRVYQRGGYYYYAD